MGGEATTTATNNEVGATTQLELPIALGDDFNNEGEIEEGGAGIGVIDRLFVGGGVGVVVVVVVNDFI